MTGNLIGLGVYAVLSVIWVLLLLMGSRRYQKLLQAMDPWNSSLKSLFAVGFAILDLIRYPYTSPVDRKRLEQIKIIYGERYGTYYFRLNTAEKATYISLGIVLAPLCGVLLGNMGLSVVGLFIGGVLYYFADSRVTDLVKVRDEELVRDFPDMISKMALLINAGMITREAWAEISRTGQGTLYNEMAAAVEDMQNGVTENDAYVAFGNRCGTPMAKKFSAMLSQNLSKGNRELVNFLKEEATLSWEEKKHLVRRMGEKANNKMMIPLGMILVGVMLMILVPILGNMGF